MFAFAADIHLCDENSGKTALFVDFLRHQAPKATALYLLGDLFDAWIGDDDDCPLAKHIATELHQLSHQTALFFMAGNRDFLLGTAYANRCGMTIIHQDYQWLSLYGMPTLLSHGDIFCTRDVAYQTWRQQTRQKVWQQSVLAQTLAARRQFAAKLRQDSQQHYTISSDQFPEQFAVDELAIAQCLQQYQAVQLIHGHTHRPGHYPLANGLWRWELGSWDDQPAVLWVTEHLTQLCNPLDGKPFNETP